MSHMSVPGHMRLRNRPPQSARTRVCSWPWRALKLTVLCWLASVSITRADSLDTNFMSSYVAQEENTVGRSLLNAQSPSISAVRRGDGTLRLTEVPEGQKRPFKVAFYYELDPIVAQDVVEYIQDTLMPTIASLLGRWIRVRLCMKFEHLQKEPNPTLPYLPGHQPQHLEGGDTSPT